MRPGAACPLLFLLGTLRNAAVSGKTPQSSFEESRSWGSLLAIVGDLRVATTPGWRTLHGAAANRRRGAVSARCCLRTSHRTARRGSAPGRDDDLSNAMQEGTPRGGEYLYPHCPTLIKKPNSTREDVLADPLIFGNGGQRAPNKVKVTSWAFPFIIRASMGRVERTGF